MSVKFATERFAGTGLEVLAQSWWLIFLRGLAGIAFGILAFVWPGLTLFTLVLFYGAYALLDGVFALISALVGKGKVVPRWWLIIVGLSGVAAGVVTFSWPGLTAVLLLYFIAAWSIVHGIFEMVGAIQLRKHIENEWWLILAGLLSVVFGVLVMAMPGAGALALVWYVGTYAIVFGVMLVALSLRLRQHHVSQA
jgi:uncharacterized membrane protein HdeD (DUF308 family)